MTEVRKEKGSYPSFTGIRTLFKLPHIADLQRINEYDFAVVGLPFDTAVTYRPGARFGPAAIREASAQVRTYNPSLGVSPMEELRGVDCGDLPLVPGNTEASLQLLQDSLQPIVDRDVMPLGLGGDHLVTLPILRSLAALHGPMALLHFDAHSDTSDRVHGEEFNHATPFRRAIDEELIVPECSIQLGIRGSTSDPRGVEAARSLGLTVLEASRMLAMSPTDLSGYVAETVGDMPLYVSFDIDFVDAASAPGTGTPEIGGPSTAQTLAYLREMDFSHLVGLDLVEVLPDLDPARVTALTAANLLFEMLSVYGLGRVD